MQKASYKHHVAVLVALLAIGWQGVCAEMCHKAAGHQHGHGDEQHTQTTDKPHKIVGAKFTATQMQHRGSFETCAANQSFVKKPRANLDTATSIVVMSPLLVGLAVKPDSVMDLTDRGPPGKIIALDIPFRNHSSILV